METPDTSTWEATLDEHCRTAGLSPIQSSLVHLVLVEGMTLRQAKLKMKLAQRVARMEWETASAKLAALPEFREAGRQFTADLVFCVEDRRVYDEREPGVRGVTPRWDSQRFQGARIVTTDDCRLRQDAPSCVRRWAERARPVAVAA